MRRQRGFTLIEVVVAFVLLAGVLGVGFELFTEGLRRAGDLEAQSRALVVAQSRLAAVGAEEGLREGVAEGDSEDRRFHWRVSVTPAPEGEAAAGSTRITGYVLYRIDVRVTWTGGNGRERAIELATLALGQRQT